MNLEKNIFLQVFDYSVDVFFFCDIIINCITPIIDERGAVITDSKDIFYNYLKGWFIIDLFATMPFELFIFFIPGK